MQLSRLHWRIMLRKVVDLFLFFSYYLCSCQVKLTGELILSFPAGIIRHLVDNPSSNTLSFRMKNTANIEQYLANKPLIVEYVTVPFVTLLW